MATSLELRLARSCHVVRVRCAALARAYDSPRAIEQINDRIDRFCDHYFVVFAKFGGPLAGSVGERMLRLAGRRSE